MRLKLLPLVILFILAVFLFPGTVLEKKDHGYPFKRPQNRRLSGRLSDEMERLSSRGERFSVWVYFTDKRFREIHSLERALTQTQQDLGARCLWRRLKALQNRPLVDDADLPVHPFYVEKVERLVKKVRTTSRWLNAVSVEATPFEIEILSKLPFVRKIDLVLSFVRQEPLPSPPSEPVLLPSSALVGFYGPSFAQINQINVFPLHQLGYSGREVLVCLMDSGFRKSHEVFRHAPIVAEWDFVNNDGDVQQDPDDPNDYSDSHGTGTWSVLGGFKPGELVGPAYGASFLLAKTETTNFERPIEEDYWVAGIEWAEALGAEVISSSLGYLDWYTFADMDGETAVTTRAANRAVSLGVVVVTAAGNERDEAWGHIIAPADGFEVISCGAVDSRGQIASFSSPGPTSDGRIKPELCAMGVDTWLAAYEEGADTYRRGSGTSFSTPLIAGTAALLLETHRDWTPVEVRTALLTTASRSQNPGNDYGWGIANAALAADLGWPALALEGYGIDDDSSGSSLGNGNGRAESGETLEISVTLKNNGRLPAAGLRGLLSTGNPEIVISRSETSFPLLGPDTSADADEPFVVKIPWNLFSRPVAFLLSVEGPQGLVLSDYLVISVSR